jgi:hypothetical protein
VPLAVFSFEEEGHRAQVTQLTNDAHASGSHTRLLTILLLHGSPILAGAPA